MICMYYSIVHTYHIQSSDMYVHVYARWVGSRWIIGSQVVAGTPCVACSQPPLPRALPTQLEGWIQPKKPLSSYSARSPSPPRRVATSAESWRRRPPAQRGGRAGAPADDCARTRVNKRQEASLVLAQDLAS